jgi:hypothetical protein
MATKPDRVHPDGAPTPHVWVPPPAAERAGPSPLQLVWTIVMVVFLAGAFIDLLINLV